jgi:hypothetical protein
MRTLIAIGIVLLSVSMVIANRAGESPAPDVLRCTLDGNPRMLVVSFGDQLWASYDTGRCQLVKVWRGDVHFTGTVYDTKHGPQPTSKGELLWENKSPATSSTQSAARWIGHRVDGSVIVLMSECDGAPNEMKLARDDETSVQRDPEFASLPVRIQTTSATTKPAE